MNDFLQRSIEQIHLVMVERMAEQEPVGDTESEESGKETFGGQRPEIDHSPIEQRREIKQLWKQQASQTDEKESIKDAS